MLARTLHKSIKFAIILSEKDCAEVLLSIRHPWILFAGWVKAYGTQTFSIRNRAGIPVCGGTMLLLEGLIIIVAGMGTVYLFLMLLVWVMGLTSRGVRALEAHGFGMAGPVTPAPVPARNDMARIAAVIAVAQRAFQGK